MAILEAEKANDKAADVPVESANLEGYEVHLVLLDKRIKEAISAMSTWERWIPVELKDELGGRVKDLRASYYRLELRCGGERDRGTAAGGESCGECSGEQSQVGD